MLKRRSGPAFDLEGSQRMSVTEGEAEVVRVATHRPLGNNLYRMPSETTKRLQLGYDRA